MNVLIKTPLQKLPNLSKEFGIDLYVKRDDLFPLYGGGNKARKMLNIYSEIKRLKPDVIITNGGAESNHARVCALLAATKGLKCHLVLHGNKLDSPFCNGNGFLMSLANASVDYCTADQIADMIELRSAEYRSAGEKVYIVPGGAHSTPGAMAYADAVKEIDIVPDYIVVASGTGATHAGLHVGSAIKYGIQTKVIGISVARNFERGSLVVTDSVNQLESFLEFQESAALVDFRDGWTCGGYGHYSSKIIGIIKTALLREGLILDPVYTGKAFLGLTELVGKDEIPHNSKVVFWHTGGLFSLQTSLNILEEKS